MLQKYPKSLILLYFRYLQSCMNALIFLMAISVTISAVLANGLKNAKDGEFEYVKDDNTLRVFRLVMPLSVILGIVVGVWEPWHWGFGAIPVDIDWASLELCAAVLFVVGLSLRWVAI
jgi:hypothetical protein